ncbi:RmlC-like cupin domain-containing protein [Phyllosticta citriasiana]|uniref:RmlC-like cupin domain-containing protein n=1 Tax=Phyllosticta citriasiana TaxID=595635 RepID=UPI0030FD9E5D
MSQSVIQLKCYCNEYPWGKLGSQSAAARIASKTPGTEFKIDESKPYAEMWFGTYPDLPSYVLETGENLQDLINTNPEHYLGMQVLSKFGHSNLPYLPKVLSIAKALPLQLHPNKELATKLHEKEPSSFTDPNHKPEIAIALTDFEAFCGFKPLADIEALLKLEPLRQFLPKSHKGEFTDATLKSVVQSMLKAPEDVVRRVESQLSAMPVSAFGQHGYIAALLPRLADQYGATDNGSLVALITMNYLRLRPGQSIYIPADGIHAYLSGDIIECMARSNNVLNTGFCPRADRDNVDTFVSVLSFKPHDAKQAILPAEPYQGSRKGFSKVYAPPMSEFDMLQTSVPAGKTEVLAPVNGPSMVVCTKGEGELVVDGRKVEVKEGYLFFIRAGVEIEYKAGKELELYTAFAQ